MKVSIITPVFNNAETIESAIKSVLQQTYSNIEYIIVDGSSTDGTLERIRNYKSKISKIISENDDGIFDAMNKGLKAATGDVIGILNSDDFYVNEFVIEKVVRQMQEKNVDSVYGDLVYVAPKNPDKIVRFWKSGPYYRGIFYSGWMPPHPTFFVKKWVFDKYGKFDTRLKNAADYELMLRFLHKYEISTTYIPQVLVKMRTGGNSNSSIINRLKANWEDRKAWEYNDLKPKFWTLTLKPLKKLTQYLRTPKNGRLPKTKNKLIKTED